jgi:hypothetical protein
LQGRHLSPPLRVKANAGDESTSSNRCPKTGHGYHELYATK